MKYVKKPIPIQAWKIDLLELKNQGDYPDWVEDAHKRGFVFAEGYKLKINTPEGQMTAEEGDYLILGVTGEYYSIKANIFDLTYEEVSDEEINSNKIELTDITDLPDGSSVIGFELGHNSLVAFAKVGLLHALRQAAEQAIKDHERP